jgi:UDP-arabinose 4-epimerase
MNILVTRGAGYVGSHARKALAEKGHVPITYDNLSRGNRWAVKWGRLKNAILQMCSRLGWCLKKYRPTALMHFAAYAYVAESVQAFGLGDTDSPCVELRCYARQFEGCGPAHGGG